MTRRHFLASAILSAAVSPDVIATAVAAPAPPPPLEEWLRTHPRVARAITWAFERNWQPYERWPEPFKAQLRSAYTGAWYGQPSGLTDPPPDQRPHRDDEPPFTILSAADAFALHAALVGNSLAMEIGGRLPWTIDSYPDAALGVLFDGRRTFGITAKPPGFALMLNGIPAPPEICLAFLRKHRMIGADRRSTILAFIDWCRDYLVHYAGRRHASVMAMHWQYRGLAPTSRVLSGTRYTGPEFGFMKDKRRHYTMGCYGTTSLLACVLRTINIPVQQLQAERHSLPHFMLEDLYLSHGDDPYAVYCHLKPTFNIADILISKAQFDAWFPPGTVIVTGVSDKTSAPPAGQLPNVGRRVHDLAIEHLPIYLLGQHATDMLKKRTREGGFVFHVLKDQYTLADLNAKTLFERLDARVAELGGPAKVRQLYDDAVRDNLEQSVATTAR